jgi:hypothetical protein
MANEEKSGPTNQVTLFSNGMGHFQRVVSIDPNNGKKISIPFKKEHIADALESLTVFGNVRYTVPPSYTPTNANDTTLVVTPNEVTQSLLKSLSGSRFSYVTFDSDWVSGTLLGVESVVSHIDNVAVQEMYVSVNTDTGIVRVPISDISKYRFDDDSVVSEIDKAIKRNFQKIKPDSTFLELSLAALAKDGITAQNAETAVVSYKIPVAAWKLRYNIRTQDDGNTILEGAAIVDNNTDEDWVDTFISVVTGNPVSFHSPDLALVNVPVRKTVPIVECAALGPVAASDVVGSAREMAKGIRPTSFAARSINYSHSNTAGFGMVRSAGGDDFEDMLESCAQMAESPGVDVKEVGDFAVFTSREPVTILAKRSAVVPMFSIVLKTCGTVLLYNQKSHARRPYRAVKFKNEATHDLGRGKVGIYTDGVFQGECILETAKPGENRTLPFCLENGVRVVQKDNSPTSRFTNLTIANGYSVTATQHTSQTTYTITNKKDEEFKLLVEHSNVLESGIDPVVTGVEIQTVEKTESGYRYYLVIGPKSEIEMTVEENSIKETRIAIANNYDWVVTNVINPKLSIAKDPAVLACMELAKKIDKLEEDIEVGKACITSLEQDCDNYRKNLQPIKDDKSTATIKQQWVDELDAAMRDIKSIKKRNQELTKELRENRDGLRTSLTNLSLTWVD